MKRAKPAAPSAAPAASLVHYCGFSTSPVRLPAAARLMLQRRHLAGLALRA